MPVPNAPRAMQPSFARGEISPLLHARVDLAQYATGLRQLKNFIVLPQGGITRRPGFSTVTGYGGMSDGTQERPHRLIPFVYNKEDSAVIIMSDKIFHVFDLSGQSIAFGSSPYSVDEIHDVKFAQMGNIIFMAHKNHPIQMLTRQSMTRWRFDPLPFEGGPWLPQSETPEGVKLRITRKNSDDYIMDSSAGSFPSGTVGSLLELNFPVEGGKAEGKSSLSPAWTTSEPIRVGGEWYLQTSDDNDIWIENLWTGTVVLEKLAGDDSWIKVREYTRRSRTDGQLSISGSEADGPTYYRVRAQHAPDAQEYMTFAFSASGYIEKNVVRVIEISAGGSEARVSWPERKESLVSDPVTGVWTDDWRVGAWGGHDAETDEPRGYPAAVAFYQDRLAAASSLKQPQNIWLSRVGDYKHFGTSDPIRDDDAINITLSASDNDGIHSLVAMADLLAFTTSGEWRIRGAGDGGAITPSAVVAHQQDNIGSAPIQPVIVGGAPIFAQSHRRAVHTIQYSLEIDSYSGSEMSIMSSHLFGWKTERNEPPADRRITAIAYQGTPDSLIWFILADGTAVTCTYIPEHNVVAWARQETDGEIGNIAVVPSPDGYDQLWALVRRGQTSSDGSEKKTWRLEVMASRESESRFQDPSRVYESSAQTLCLNFDGGEGATLPARKFESRVSVLALRSTQAYVCPVNERQRRQTLRWDYSPMMTCADVMLDNGFSQDAALELWVSGDFPLTVLAVSPTFTPGG